MYMLTNKKAVSTLTFILLLIIAAIAGGLISYMFTIASYIEMPKGAVPTITSIYFDKENARSFKIGVLNPSYSPADATITRIALSLTEGSQLYDIVETEPPIQNGIAIPKGKSLNITCSKAQKEGVNVTWGEFAGEFAGENITVHVFSPDSPATNKEATLPFVKLQITDTDFDSKVSFRRFNITMRNDAQSEINLTINEILVPGVNDLRRISPELPHIIATEPVQFTFNGSWHGLTKTKLTVFTEEGYIFSKDIELPQVYAMIQKVIFNENYTDHFNVTVSNLAESANYVNVTKIMCTLENGTSIERTPSVGIAPNSTFTFKFDWNWKEYRGKKINVTAYLLQDFETDTFITTAPSPIIVKVLNEKEVFDLKDRAHFNITLQNHRSSLDAVNITEMLVKETGEVINGTKADPQLPYGAIAPNQATSFYCNISDWTERARRGENLTLIIHAITNQTLGNYTFEFVFTLPAAELNISNIIHTEINGTRYLNITVENLDYSVWNLTTSKVIITLQNQTEPLEQMFPKNQMILKPGDRAVLLCLFDWEKHQGENITITVITSEGVEASQTYHIPYSIP